jgi:hypothetical protein
MLMVGGSDALDDLSVSFYREPVFIFLGLCLLGLSAGFVSIPVLPEMLESVEQDAKLADQFDLDAVENIISGLFVSFQSIGEAAGPLISSALTDAYGFTISQEIYVIYLFTFTTLYFFMCGTFSMCAKASVIEDRESDTDR